jgi:rhodanese-related sulfurtransferase
MMSRYLLAACVARSAAFQARRTCRRALSTRALPPHLEQVKADVAAGAALLLDVREPHEWAGNHFASAISAPLSALQQGDCPPEALDASKCLYLHCAAGIRVHPAKACLEALGFDNVVSLREGIGELYELGFDALADRE